MPQPNQSDITLKTVLTRAATTYALQRRADSPLPCLVYRRISEKDYVTHGGSTTLSRNRFQIIHVASTYTALRNLVDDVKNLLIGNNVDFNACIPTETMVENREAENIFVSTKDYFIWFN